MNTETKTPQLQKESIYKMVDCIISAGDAGEHLEALHEMYVGFMKTALKTDPLDQPSEEHVNSITYAYEDLKELLREIVKAEKEHQMEKDYAAALIQK